MQACIRFTHFQLFAYGIQTAVFLTSLIFKYKDLGKLIDILIEYNLLLGVYSNSNPVPVTEPPL